MAKEYEYSNGSSIREFSSFTRNESPIFVIFAEVSE